MSSTPRILQDSPAALAEAASLIHDGRLVAFPTETVYGLGGDATQAVAVMKIYTAKHRPTHNPLIIHVSDLAEAEALAEFNDRARSVAAALWPGPITLVLKARPDNGIAPNATAGLPTIALRVPAHPVARAFLKACGVPIAAPSANPSGQLSPTTPMHVARNLGHAVDMVLAGGASDIGIESTVLDLTGEVPKILRPGAIGTHELRPLLGDVAFTDGSESIKAPGQLRRHYAPKTPLRLNAVDVKLGEGFLGFGNTNFIGVETVGFLRDMNYDHWRNLSQDGDLNEAATNLYAMLHDLDLAGLSSIAVQKIPETGLGIAINDRLRRAAEKE
jgi:L-threonylcarbamoyladenylate synthase